MKHIILISLILSLPCLASAEEKKIRYPAIHRVFHPDERGVIVIDCTSSDYSNPYSNITCEFKQTNISYELDPTKLDEEIKKGIEDLEKNATDEEIEKLTSEKSCKEMQTDKVKQGMETLKKESPEKYVIVKEFADISCNTKSKKEILDILKKGVVLEKKIKSKTCKIWNNSWNEEFTYKNSSDGYYWKSTTEATGLCGVINISTFKRADPTWDWSWDYESRRVITDPDEETFGGKCKNFDERVVKYSWKIKDYPMHCEYIKFGI